MKKIFLFVLSLIVFSSAFSQTGNDTTKYTWYKYTYGNRLQRYWADSVLDIPHDTVFSKYGIARIGGTAFIGNGVKWTVVAGSGTGITLADLSALPPISYNNLTGVFSADTTPGLTHFATQAQLPKLTTYNLDSVVSKGGTFSANRVSEFNSKTWQLDSLKAFSIGYFNSIGPSSNGAVIIGQRDTVRSTNVSNAGSLIVGFGNVIANNTNFSASVMVGNNNTTGGAVSNAIVVGRNNTQYQVGATFGEDNYNAASSDGMIMGSSDSLDNAAASSFVAGYKNRGGALYNYLAGYNNKTNRSFQSAFGQFNDTTGAYYLAMWGWGTTDATRKNAAAIDTSGYYYGKGVVNPGLHKFIMPVETSDDTLATRSFARSIGRGGGLDSGIYVNNTITKTITSTSIGLKVDTTVIATKSYVNNLTDSFTLRTPGTGTGAIAYAFSNAGALVVPKHNFLAPLVVTVQSDSLITHSVDTSNGLTHLATQAYADSVALANAGAGASDVVTTITSGTSSTVPNGTNVIRFNNTSPITYTLTLPTTWHTSNSLIIAFTANGSISNNNPMVTLTLVAGSGQSLSNAVSISGTTFNAGESVQYHLISTIDQRIN